MEREMFYGANPDLFAKAKALRENMTHAEKILWSCLKENQLGVRFKPQLPMDIFIADFYCHKIKLVIEMDGESHAHQIEYDNARSEELKNNGIKIIRFSNAEVQNEIQKVLLFHKIINPGFTKNS